MSRPATVVLDNEAIDVLATVNHAKHRQMVARLEAVAARTTRRAGSVAVVVPTAVRVEAGWDRTAPSSAWLNRFGLRDHVLDGPAADIAAREGRALGLSVADAHLAAVLATAPAPVTVYTSDVDDMRRVASRLDRDITVAHT